MSKEAAINQVCMFLLIFELEYGRHLARLRRRRRRRAYAPTSNSASWVSSYMGIGLRLAAFGAAETPP